MDDSAPVVQHLLSQSAGEVQAGIRQLPAVLDMLKKGRASRCMQLEKMLPSILSKLLDVAGSATSSNTECQQAMSAFGRLCASRPQQCADYFQRDGLLTYAAKMMSMRRRIGRSWQQDSVWFLPAATRPLEALLIAKAPVPVEAVSAFVEALLLPAGSGALEHACALRMASLLPALATPASTAGGRVPIRDRGAALKAVSRWALHKRLPRLLAALHKPVQPGREALSAHLPPSTICAWLYLMSASFTYTLGELRGSYTDAFLLAERATLTQMEQEFVCAVGSSDLSPLQPSLGMLSCSEPGMQAPVFRIIATSWIPGTALHSACAEARAGGMHAAVSGSAGCLLPLAREVVQAGELRGRR